MRQPMYPEVPPQLKPPIPSGLNILMNDLSKEVLRTNPEDIYKFCAQHFERLLKIRDGELPSEQGKLKTKPLPTHKRNPKHKKIEQKSSNEIIEDVKVVVDKAKNSDTEQENTENQDGHSSFVPELTTVIKNKEIRPASVESNLTGLKGEDNEQVLSNSNITIKITEDSAIDNEGLVGKEVEVVDSQLEYKSLKLIGNSEHEIDEINKEIICDFVPVINKFNTLPEESEFDPSSNKKDQPDNLELAQSETLDEHSRRKNYVEETAIPVHSQLIQKAEKPVSIELKVAGDDCLTKPSIFSDDQIVENIPQAKNELIIHVSIDGIHNANQNISTKEETDNNFKLQKEVNNIKDKSQAEIVAKVEEGILNKNVEKTDNSNNMKVTKKTEIEAPEKKICERKVNETIETVIIAETSIPHRINDQVQIEGLNDIQKQRSVNETTAENEQIILKPTIADSNIVMNDIIKKSETLENSNSKEGNEKRFTFLELNTSHIQNTAQNDENMHNDVQGVIEAIKPSKLQIEEIASRENLVENIPNSEDKQTDTTQATEGENYIPRISDETNSHVINIEIVEENYIPEIDDVNGSVHMVEDTKDAITKENVALLVDSEEAMHPEGEPPGNNHTESKSSEELSNSNELSNQAIISDAIKNAENMTATIQEHNDTLSPSKFELASDESKQYIDMIESKENNSEVIEDHGNKSKGVNFNHKTLDDRTIKVASEYTKLGNDEDANHESLGVDRLPLIDGNMQLAMENNSKIKEVISNNDKSNDEQNIMVDIAKGTENKESKEMSEISRKSSDKHIANLSMDMETAAITIQKVFRSFLFRSKSSNPDESIDGQRSETEELVDRENNIFGTISEFNLPNSEPIIDSNVLLTRMNSVLQTVNEEKSSLSTDESSDTLSSAATKIQAHVRGFLVRNKYNSNKTCNSSDTTAPSMGEDSKSLDDYSLNELPNEKQVIRITLTDPKLIESVTDDCSVDAANNNVDMTLRAQSSDRASEARRRLKREDAIQSISPFSSSDTPTIIQSANKESGSDEQDQTSISEEEAEDRNKILNINEDDKIIKNINDSETESTDNDTLKHYPKTPVFKNNEITKMLTGSKESSSEDQEWSEENEFEIPKILEDTVTPARAETLQHEQDEILQITITEPNNENVEGISSDEMDVVTPISIKSTTKCSHENAKVHEMIMKTADDDSNEKDSDVKPGLVTTGEFHDVPLPTRVIRQNSSIVREFDAVILLYLIWKHK